MTIGDGKLSGIGLASGAGGIGLYGGVAFLREQTQGGRGGPGAGRSRATKQ